MTAPIGPKLFYNNYILFFKLVLKFQHLKWLEQNIWTCKFCENAPILESSLFFGNMGINITCNSRSWIDTYQPCWDRTISSPDMIVYSFGFVGMVLNPRHSFVIWTLGLSYRANIGLKALPIKLLPLILSLCVANKFTPNHVIKSYNNLCVLHRGMWGFWNPRFVCHPTVFSRTQTVSSIEPYLQTVPEV